MQRQTPVRRHLHGSHKRIKSPTKDMVSQASQSSFCHRQLSCLTALPMQHFSSLKPREILNVLAQTFRYSFIHPWNGRSTCNRTFSPLPIVSTVIGANTRQCRSGTIVSTLHSDRDNKIHHMHCSYKHSQQPFCQHYLLFATLGRARMTSKVSPAWSCSTCGLASVLANG